MAKDKAKGKTNGNGKAFWTELKLVGTDAKGVTHSIPLEPHPEGSPNMQIFTVPKNASVEVLCASKGIYIPRTGTKRASSKKS